MTDLMLAKALVNALRNRGRAPGHSFLERVPRAATEIPELDLSPAVGEEAVDKTGNRLRQSRMPFGGPASSLQRISSERPKSFPKSSFSGLRAAV